MEAFAEPHKSLCSCFLISFNIIFVSEKVRERKACGIENGENFVSNVKILIRDERFGWNRI